jgi:hypothetical protein
MLFQKILLLCVWSVLFILGWFSLGWSRLGWIFSLTLVVSYSAELCPALLAFNENRRLFRSTISHCFFLQADKKITGLRSWEKQHKVLQFCWHFLGFLSFFVVSLLPTPVGKCWPCSRCCFFENFLRKIHTGQRNNHGYRVNIYPQELEVVKQQKNSKIQGSVNKTGELCVVSPNFSVQWFFCLPEEKTVWNCATK